MTSFLASKKFWIRTAERAVKSGAQGAILAFGAGQVNALDVSWSTVGGFFAGMAALSILTSLAKPSLVVK